MATLKKLMTLLSAEGLLAQRADIIREWTDGRTTSARELTESEITEMCFALDKASLRDFQELDLKRKRVIAAIFGVLEMHNKLAGVTKENQLSYVKSIACRAAQVNDFNSISPDSLTSLYASFKKAQKYDIRVGRMIDGWINEQKSYN